MKKLLLSLFACVFGLMVYAQPVSDNATIPVSVTLNTILRLNVTSGGNIEFAFNTITDYTSGISTSSQYTTTFTVASSDDFDVATQVDDATFIGSDAGGTMALNYVGFTVADDDGGGTSGITTAGYQDLTTGTTQIIDEGGAGAIAVNRYTMSWECGTSNTTGGSLLGSGVAPDRYSTNVSLVLSVD